MSQDPKMAKRAAQALTLSAELAEAVRKANAATMGPGSPELTAEGVQALWADVANYAGQIQRRSRLLAGLGRGG